MGRTVVLRGRRGRSIASSVTAVAGAGRLASRVRRRRRGVTSSVALRRGVALRRRVALRGRRRSIPGNVARGSADLLAVDLDADGVVAAVGVDLARGQLAGLVDGARRVRRLGLVVAAPLGSGSGEADEGGEHDLGVEHICEGKVGWFDKFDGR